MGGNAHLYLGKAGHLRVMSEFLLRGYNVATPEVDIGDDIYVVQDKEGTLWTIQVKTATATPQKHGYSALIKIPLKQLRQPKDPDLRYIIAVRDKNSWAPYLIIRRSTLDELYKIKKVGTKAGSYIHFRFTYDKRTDSLKCGKHDVSSHRDDWNEWPEIITSAPKPKM